MHSRGLRSSLQPDADLVATVLNLDEHEFAGPAAVHKAGGASRGAGGRHALQGKGPRRRPRRQLDRRLEEVAKAVGGGYCQLQMPLKLALGVRGTVAGLRLAPPLAMHPLWHPLQRNPARRPAASGLSSTPARGLQYRGTLTYRLTTERRRDTCAADESLSAPGRRVSDPSNASLTMPH